MGYYAVVLLCVVALLAFNEITSLRRVIKDQENRLSQLEKMIEHEINN
ncbi:hypothetical protein [Lacrimispora amygdalina]|nr:hypothetical protein [Lacrimispora amygdalina]